MKTLSIGEIGSLPHARIGTHVSLYMPTHRSGPERQQDPIRFRNLLRVAEARLAACGIRSREATEILAPAYEMPLVDPGFWERQGNGLAVFLWAEGDWCCNVPRRVEQLAFVGKRFHLKPLLPLLQGKLEFYVLGLSQNGVRLIRATRDTAAEVELEGVPTTLREALRYDDPEKQLQFHTQTPRIAGRRAAIFFGTGAGADEGKDRIPRYFRQLDQCLRKVLGESRAPLVLAGVDYLLPIFREASSYRHLVQEGIAGDPRFISPDELRDRAWPLVRPLCERGRGAAADRHVNLAGTGLTSDRLDEVLPAAVAGRVESLFVDVGRQHWGRFDSRSGACEAHQAWEPGDDDLLDLAAVQSLLHGGAVYAVCADGVPGGREISAVFRY